jgi:hypothetical protein
MLTAKIKACLLYGKDLLPVNLILSLLIALGGVVYGLPFWKTFSFSLVTGGAFFSSYLYKRRRGHQFYFFYNLGISLGVLQISALLMDILLAAGVLLVKNNLR